MEKKLSLKQLFGLNLRTLRNRTSKSQLEIGVEVGVSASSVNRWEQGLSLPDSEKIELLSEYFGVNFSYFFVLDNEDRMRQGKIHLKQAIKMINELVEKELKEVK